MSVDESYNFRVIDDAVSTAGLLSEEQLSELSQCGYEVVINLLPHDSEYAIKNEEPIVVGQGVDYGLHPGGFC
ncbi:MAG: hypothetical protein U5K56_11805 [Halioglobus sp.]|nr:hypothetical protein [Halioglobus sp.]